MAQFEGPFESEQYFENLPNFETKRARDQRSHSSRKSDKQRNKRIRLSANESNSSLKDKSAAENLEAVIIDNGACTIKFGSSKNANPMVMPNCIMKAKSERKRLFIGNQIDECRDCSGLYYLLPCERGYITKWDVQKPVWDYAFSKSLCPIVDNTVLMTQPIFNFKPIQDCIDEIFFEEYEISSFYRANATDFVRMKYIEEIGNDIPCIVVDSGFSFTHVVPYIEKRKYFKAVKRIGVGGKVLTNHLKDIISYRQYHVMEETYVINQVKEDTCYVAEDFKADLKIAASKKNNTILKNYVLPDFNAIRRGYIHEPTENDSTIENCQILRLNNERFCVPEILFHPSDIGIKQMGIAEAVAKSIKSCPVQFQKQLAKNIILVGGNINFPGFKNRFYAEVRSLLPDTWEVNVYKPDDPITYAWEGGKSYLKVPNFKSMLVTKAEYEEHGSSITYKKFNNWSSFVEEKPKKIIEVKPISIIDQIKKYNVFGKGNGNENNPSEVQSQSNKPEAGPSKPNTEENIPLNDVLIENDPGESNSTSDSFRSVEVSKSSTSRSRGKKKRRDVDLIMEEDEENNTAEQSECLFEDDIFPFGTSYL